MLKSTSSYHEIIAILRDKDFAQESIFISGLGRSVDFALVGQDLYRADGTGPDKVWRRVDFGRMSTRPAPMAPAAPMDALAHATTSQTAALMPLTPPPPYSLGACRDELWPTQSSEDMAVAGQHFVPRTQGMNTVFAQPVPEQARALATPCVRDTSPDRHAYRDPATGRFKEVPTPERGLVENANRQNSSHGAAAIARSRNTLASRAAKAFYRKVLVDAQTGKPATANTREPITRQAFFNRQHRARKALKRAMLTAD